MTTGGVPWYIDQDARHSAKTARVLAYLASRGQQGVMRSDHCRVSALATPGASVTVDPGAFAILNRATTGSFESYIDKFDSQMTLAVTPTPAATRTDLVILRVENPYAGGVGTGTWSIPADPVAGPYWVPRVVEGVSPANINSVTEWSALWSAIPLARIKRTNSSVVVASDITDLRSLVDLSGERVTIINNPSTSPPPIAAQFWSDTVHCATVTTFSYATTAWTDWPAVASFSVPVPSWAVEADIIGTFNPQYTDNTWGNLRMMLGTLAGPSIMFDENVSAGQLAGPGPQQLVIPLGGTLTIPSNIRGTVQTLKAQVQMLDPAAHHGNLGTRSGVYFNVFMNFKRYPN